jgi:uncharacterized membrane protein
MFLRNIVMCRSIRSIRLVMAIEKQILHVFTGLLHLGLCYIIFTDSVRGHCLSMFCPVLLYVADKRFVQNFGSEILEVPL